MKTKLFMAEGRLEPVRFAEIVFTASGMISEVLVEELERTCEIGVMRAIGASNRDIQGIVIIEGLVIGLISWTVAILIAILTAPMPAVYRISGIVAWLVSRFSLPLSQVPSPREEPHD